MTPLIYTVGDSHSWHTWLKIPFVETHPQGPMTMHRAGQERTIYVNQFPKDAIVVFCWGEIDCRCHVHKYQPWQEAIDRLVDNYLNMIEANYLINPNVWIYNVVPPLRKKDAIESPDFPFLGTDQERLGYVRYMNEKLKASPYFFVDVNDQYSDAEGFLRQEVSDAHVHIEDSGPLEAYLRERIPEHALSDLRA